MNKERFDAAGNWIRSKSWRMTVFTVIYKYLPVAVFAAYPLLLGYLLLTRDRRFFICFSVPLFMFVTLSAARRFLDLERPYEKYDITPIFPKNTKGRSFPSRHTASAAVIAVTFLYINRLLGAVFLLNALLIGASRAAGGVHFLRDVAAGIIYAMLCGLVYFLF